MSEEILEPETLVEDLPDEDFKYEDEDEDEEDDEEDDED